MPTAEEKLDRVLTQLGDFRVEFAGMRGDLRSGLARIDTHDVKANDVEQRLRAVEHQLAATPPDTEARLRAVERFQWKQIGAAAVASGTVSSLVAWLATHH